MSSQMEAAGDSRELRAEIVVAVEDLDKILSEELSQISLRKRELDQQIEQTQKRLTQQVSALRAQVKHNAKITSKAEERLQKKNHKKPAKPRRPSEVTAGSSNPSLSILDSAPLTRQAAAQLFFDRSRETEAHLSHLINARQAFLLSRLAQTQPLDHSRVEEEDPLLDSLSTSPSGPKDAQFQMASHDALVKKKILMASLLRLRIPEFQA
ncbi:MAG: hypothetical protein Q8P67_06600 [archaeon]|nr:hypothetical protein [archaeon]